MKVQADLKIYEVHGKSTDAYEVTPLLRVLSHWNGKDRVVLEFGDTQVVVLSGELRRAIEAVQEAHPW